MKNYFEDTVNRGDYAEQIAAGTLTDLTDLVWS